MSDRKEKLLTPEARLLYPHLFEPSAAPGSTKETYNCVLVFPKDADLSALIAAHRKVLTEDFKGAKNVRNPFGKGSEHPEWGGGAFVDCVFIRVSSMYPPAVVDANRQDIIDKDQVYSGCYARAVVRPYSYDTAGNKGISFGLDAIQILRDGEQIGGGAASVGMFDDGLSGSTTDSGNDPFAE